MTQVTEVAGEPAQSLNTTTGPIARRPKPSVRLSCAAPAPQDASSHPTRKDAGNAHLEDAVDLSDVRLDKVAKLKAAIADGSYHVPASALADKLIEVLTR